MVYGTPGGPDGRAPAPLPAGQFAFVDVGGAGDALGAGLDGPGLVQARPDDIGQIYLLNPVRRPSLDAARPARQIRGLGLHEANSEAAIARERQFYEDVMDVALRATLKKFGFKRKSHATYIMDRPDRRWILELESEPRLGAGFEAFSAVHVPELDAIFEKYAPGFRVHQAPTRARSHVMATIPQLMEVAAGHDYYTCPRGPASDDWSKEYEAAQNDPVMKYQHNSWWVLPKIPTMKELGYDEEEHERMIWNKVEETGRFLDEQWRAYVPAWYESCDDHLFLAGWIEHQAPNIITTGCTLGVLCHMGGDDNRAADFFHDRLQEADISYAELHKNLHNEYRGSWLKQLWLGGGWSEEEVESTARGRFKYYQETAEATHRLADGLGIAL